MVGALELGISITDNDEEIKNNYYRYVLIYITIFTTMISMGMIPMNLKVTPRMIGIS